MRTETTPYDDRTLFRDIARGDQPAFATFFHRYNAKVFFFVLDIVDSRAIAEEITQDVFLKLWLSRDTLTAIDNPGSYLFVMARNRTLNQLERQQHERRFKQYLTGKGAGATDPDEQLFYRESLHLINQVVETLPDQQRRIFQMAKLEGLTRDEIAQALDLSPNTVKNHLGAAVRTVQQYLIQHGHLVTVLLFFNFLGRN